MLPSHLGGVRNWLDPMLFNKSIVKKKELFPIMETLESTRYRLSHAKMSGLGVLFLGLVLAETYVLFITGFDYVGLRGRITVVNDPSNSHTSPEQQSSPEPLSGGRGDSLVEGSSSFPSEKNSLSFRLEQFVEQNPDTPGARFIRLLRDYLHYEPGAEAKRLSSCSNLAIKDAKNVSFCFGGGRNYQKAMDSLNGDDLKLEHATSLVLWEDRTDMNVYKLRRYNGTDRLIPYLGTQAACLPLILAGYAAQEKPDNVVVELGPFAGLSSRCILVGMLKHGVHEGAYRAFDTFEGVNNWRAISYHAPWLKKEHPEFNENQTDFLFLWKMNVESVYPAAQASVGWINKDTLNPTVLGHKHVSMLSIDSAKSARMLIDQLEGLGIIATGTIIFLMDFEFVPDQVRQIYACLREEFLIPVYASFSMEHWAWIVTKDFSFEDGKIRQCFANLGIHNKNITRMERLLDGDTRYLCGLSADNQSNNQCGPQRQIAKEKMIQHIRFGPEALASMKQG
jgi:hypothetical protein